jgi:hypothetical protein
MIIYSSSLYFTLMWWYNGATTTQVNAYVFPFSCWIKVIQPHKLYIGCNLLFIICTFRLSMNHKQPTKHNLILAFQMAEAIYGPLPWTKQLNTQTWSVSCSQMNRYNTVVGVTLKLTVTRRARQFEIHYKSTKDLKLLTELDTGSYKDFGLLQSLLTCSSHNYHAGWDLFRVIA